MNWITACYAKLAAVFESCSTVFYNSSWLSRLARIYRFLCYWLFVRTLMHAAQNGDLKYVVFLCVVLAGCSVCELYLLYLNLHILCLTLYINYLDMRIWIARHGHELPRLDVWAARIFAGLLGFWWLQVRFQPTEEL
ncbi:hypothetical protein BDV95DRAFT_587946 [Massariosphaeria phaeospora]|uniref:Uncharacterized protein n=1 Tax=Massariosphaeria phaeospora TaxID=100035 RepID=A0A7C8M1R9_9PLEO|nr:hypothetical protein BDV95DRAFT_587946 [Massariosphaeria phaeospora]